MVALVAQSLGEAKVYEFDVAVLVQQEVFRLEVSVGHAALLLVQVFQDEDNLGGIKLRRGFVEAPEFAEVAE